jgi:PPOX class probable FMN-dependent enzyme
MKVSDHITPEYSVWIASSSFCALASVGPEGVDASPRGDIGEVVFELDAKTLVMPDRRGNNRMDSLRNIVSDGRVALMLLTKGASTVMRVNGRAEISVAPDLLEQFAVKGQLPRSVIVIYVGEIYFQCARAVMRAGLWDVGNWPDISALPSAGQILQAQKVGDFDGEAYDKEWPERVKKSLW